MEDRLDDESLLAMYRVRLPALLEVFFGFASAELGLALFALRSVVVGSFVSVANFEPSIWYADFVVS